MRKTLYPTFTCLALTSVAIISCSSIGNSNSLKGSWNCQSNSKYQNMDIAEQFRFTLNDSQPAQYQMLGTLDFSQTNEPVALLDFKDSGSWDYKSAEQIIELSSDKTWSIKPRQSNFISQLIAGASKQVLQQNLNSVNHQLKFQIDWKNSSNILLHDISDYPSSDMGKQEAISCSKQ